jgi:hypothetical protein
MGFQYNSEIMYDWESIISSRAFQDFIDSEIIHFNQIDEFHNPKFILGSDGSVERSVHVMVLLDEQMSVTN